MGVFIKLNLVYVISFLQENDWFYLHKHDIQFYSDNIQPYLAKLYNSKMCLFTLGSEM